MRDERRIWLLIGTSALVIALLLAAFFWYLESVSTTGGEPGEGMPRIASDLSRAPESV